MKEKLKKETQAGVVQACLLYAILRASISLDSMSLVPPESLIGCAVHATKQRATER